MSQCGTAKKLAIYGVGDLGSEVLELSKRCDEVKREYDEVFFVDDDTEACAPEGMRLVDFKGLVQEASSCCVEAVVCMGEPRVRALVAEKVCKAGIKLATLIHPSVEVPENSSFGDGCLVYPGTYVGPNAHVGSNTLIIRGVIAHDCVVGRDCVFSAGATLSGHDVVGDQTYIAVAAAVKEAVTIGSRVIVGMGSMVFRDVADDLIVLGNPARPMKRNENQKVFKG